MDAAADGEGDAARVAESPVLDAGPDAATLEEGEAGAAPLPTTNVGRWSSRPPVLVASTEVAEVRGYSRKGQLLGRLPLPGVAFGLRHDRRHKDGFWILHVGPEGVLVSKLDDQGIERRRLRPERHELPAARRLLALDYVFGHQPAGDLLLVLYDNVRGVPVVEGLSVSTGETRFATRFSPGAFAGLRGETYRHGPAQSLILLEWWVVRDGRELELWRYDRGFLSRSERRHLPVSVLAFDLPPWRELFGISAGGLTRISPDGAPGPVVALAEFGGGAISIDE